MKRLLFLLPVLALLPACHSDTYTVRTYALNSKAERQVCTDYETKAYTSESGVMLFGTSDDQGAWRLSRCSAYKLLDEQTVVGYVGSNSTLVKCKVSREFYDHYAEGQAYEIPISQCRVIDVKEGK